MIDLPPKPHSRPEKYSFLKYLKAFRQDIISAQPNHLYRAWMAEFRTAFFHSFLINQPALIQLVLQQRPDDFPKSARIATGLYSLLGESVFLTTGSTWQRQRRIVNPAFEGGRLQQAFPAMQAAADAFLAELSPGTVDVEPLASKLAADVIFRTLFSVPIEDKTASKVFDAFRTYQRQQPVANLAALVPALRWLPFWQNRRVKRSALEIRRLITHLTYMRQDQIAAGRAPQDLATRLLSTQDPETGTRLSLSEMVDQVMIFFLAGHETSAAALSWALYLLARYPHFQDQVAQEASHLTGSDDFAAMRNLSFTRDVFRETLRLYPPVPMMVREVRQRGEVFRGRRVPKNSLIIISPWYVQRHNRIWERPDEFDPLRWQEMPGADCQRQAFLPFSSGPRICPGAGFAMVEGPYLLARIVQNYRLSCRDLPVPQPLAHLTLRARSGIYRRFDLR